MRHSFFGTAALAASLLAGGAAAAPAVTGDYVESRSANIYVGACHHEGEIQTAGRNAVLAWSFNEGTRHGVSLAGVKVVAVVAADRHLGFEDAVRRSVLYVSEGTTGAQKKAAIGLIMERAAKSLGTGLAIKEAPIRFVSGAHRIEVEVPGVASLKIRKQTAELCCKQPYETWGKPFFPINAARAGYCESAGYKDGQLLQSWSATDQNNAFFGQFAL